jgi:hypothetical protein
MSFASLLLSAVLISLPSSHGNTRGLRIDSNYVWIGGMTDTTGRSEERINRPISPNSCLPGNPPLPRFPGPWREWRDTASPWFTWRFKPRLACHDGKIAVIAESLLVAFGGGAFSPPRESEGVRRVDGEFTDGGFTVDGGEPPLRFLRPFDLVGSAPRPGMGPIRLDSSFEIRGGDASSWGWLHPRGGWASWFPDSVRVLLVLHPVRDGKGGWKLASGGQPLTYLGVMAKEFGKSFGLRPLEPSQVPPDSIYLALDSSAISFGWAEFRQNLTVTAFLQSAPGDTLTWVLHEVKFSSRLDGSYDHAVLVAEAMGTYLDWPLPDSSVVRAREPIRLRRRMEEGKTSLLLVAPGIEWISPRGARIPAQDTSFRLDPTGMIMDSVLPAENRAQRPSLLPRSGRIRMTLGGRILKIDRERVSRAEWNRCARAGGCPTKALEDCGAGGWRGNANGTFHDQAWKRLPEMPVVCATPQEAEAYCERSGGRLPTPEEYALFNRAIQDSIRAWKGRPQVVDPAFRSGHSAYDLTPPVPVGTGLPVAPGFYDLDETLPELCSSASGNDLHFGEFFCRGASPGSAGRARLGLGFRCFEPVP